MPIVSTTTARPKAPIALSGGTCVNILTSSCNTHANGYCRIEKIDSGLKPLEVVVVAAAITRLSRLASSRGEPVAPLAS